MTALAKSKSASHSRSKSKTSGFARAPSIKRKENGDNSFKHRYIEDEENQGFSRQGKLGQEEPNSKGYRGVLFFEEEDDNASRSSLIRRKAIGPYDDDDDDDGDEDSEGEDFYQDNDDYNVETYSRPKRRKSLYE